MTKLTPEGDYDRDVYAWANEQASLLRAGKVGLADLEHIAEEIESMGNTEKRELVSRLTVLTAPPYSSGGLSRSFAARVGG